MVELGLEIKDGISANLVFLGHLDAKQLDIAEPLAEESRIKREYLAEGVRRIPVEVSY